MDGSLRPSTTAAATLLAVASILCSSVAACARNVIENPDGLVLMEETTAEKNPEVTWQVLRKTLECIKRNRLDEVDQWLMYAMRNASSDPLLASAESLEFLSSGLAKRATKGSATPPRDDVVLLQALLKIRFSRKESALESLRSIEKTYPAHHAIIQIKQRIYSLDKLVHPPPTLPPKEDMTAEELKQALDRIAREKVIRSANQKTLEQALSEAKDEVFEKEARWDSAKFPLKVFIPTEGSCLKIPGYAKGDRSALVASFQMWQSTMGNRIKFAFVPTASEASIDCEWVDHPDKLGAKSKDAIGTCQSTWDGSLSRKHAKIRILTFRSSSQPAFRQQYLKNVALHEIGHALGADHLPDPNTIMYFQLQVPLLEKLTAPDINAMNAIIDNTKKRELHATKVAAAQKRVASSDARIKKDEVDIRTRGIDFDRDLSTARDLERMNVWEQSNSIFEKALKFRPEDEQIRQSSCRTALKGGRVALKKNEIAKAITLLELAKLRMNSQTPIANRQLILDLLQASYELNNQQTEAEKVRTLLFSGSY